MLRTKLISIIRQLQPRNTPKKNLVAIRQNSSLKGGDRIRNELIEVLDSISEVTTSGRKNYETAMQDITEEEAEQMIYSREFRDLKVEDYESLYNDDPTGEKKAFVETVLKEYEYHKYNSLGRVPSDIILVDMIRFFEEGQTVSARDKLFNFFYKREMVKRAQSIKKRKEKAEKSALQQAKLDKFTELYGGKRTGLLTDKNELIYGLWHNSLFLRIPDNKIKVGASASRLATAAMFGPRLIFDFDFENSMAPWVSRNAIDQVQEAYGLNRFKYQEPFDLWFCNLNQKTQSAEYLMKNAIANLFTTSMITVKDDCFTNYFDKSRLVYLSPDAREKVTDVGKNDDVYIIGVYNDKGGGKPLTYRKAAKLGIRARSLPLDSYLAWQGGSKSLCVNHVTGILLEVMANGGDWRKAFIRHIPTRKIKPLEVVMEEEERRLAKLRHKKKMSRFSLREDLDFS